MSNLSIHDLRKTYSGADVLNIPHLEFEKGIITAIIGANGAGKSTLLHIIDGLIKPDKGKVIYNQAEHSASITYDIPTARTKAHVFQKPLLFNSTVYNNIAYGLKIRGAGASEIRKKVAETAELTDLTSLLKRKAITLSGGEAGRVSIARVLALQPDLLLLDEPTADLDPGNILTIEKIILRTNQDFGTTIILVTHNMLQVKRLSKNVVLLIDGKVAEYGSTGQLFENPASKQAKDFISGKLIY
jgi:tungstate transport system ATP-binding protein